MAKQSLGRFSEKGRQLQKILLEFLNDEILIKLIQNKSYDPITPSLPVGFDSYSLLNTKLYTQVYRPPTDEESVYVCVFYKKGGIGGNNTYYKNSDITVAIIVHRDLWNVEGGLRAFEIADRIDYILNRNNTTESLSNDWFKGFRYYPVDDFYGVIELDYSNWD